MAGAADTMTAAPAAGTRAGPGRPAARAGPVRIAFGVAAALLVLLAARAPVWEARLSAPQFPDGLSLTAYADRVEGDIEDVNALNHYVGMKPFDLADVPEHVLWLPTLGAALALIAAGSLGGRRWWARLARLGLWAIPIGVLADIQIRLYQYGHSLDPKAALRPDPFTPLVVGPTHVLNFTNVGYPGAALLLLLLAAFLVTFGPGLVDRWLRARARSAAAAGSEA